MNCRDSLLFYDDEGLYAEKEIINTAPLNILSSIFANLLEKKPLLCIDKAYKSK